MQKREVKGNHAKDQEGGGGMSIQHINVEHIRQDGGTQARAAWIESQPKSLKGKAA